MKIREIINIPVQNILPFNQLAILPTCNIPQKNVLRSTYIVYSIDKWIITAVAHRQPIAAEEYDVDIMKPKSI